jgi:hypothetical protein
MSDDGEIRSLLATFERVLRTNDAEPALGCYLPDGIGMPPGQSSASGPLLRDAHMRSMFNQPR